MTMIACTHSDRFFCNASEYFLHMTMIACTHSDRFFCNASEYFLHMTMIACTDSDRFFCNASEYSSHMTMIACTHSNASRRNDLGSSLVIALIAHLLPYYQLSPVPVPWTTKSTCPWPT